MTDATGPAVGRYRLLTAAVQTYDNHPDGEAFDRLMLAHDVARIQDMFVRRMGYELTDLSDERLTREEIREGIRAFCGSSKSEDHLVIYLTGHSEIVQDDDVKDHYFLPSETDFADIVATAIPTTDFARWILSGTKVRRLLLIFDTCYSGKAATDFAYEVSRRMRDIRAEAKTGGSGVAVLSSSLSIQRAIAGEFTKAFVQAVDAWPFSAGRPEQVTLEAVLERILTEHRTALIQFHTIGRGVLPAFLRDPNRKAELEKCRQKAQALSADEKDKIFSPTIEGFVGRATALDDLSGWLTDGAGPACAVVTGDPGAGKTAVLGMLIIASDEQRRPQIARASVAGAIPAVGAVDSSVHMGGQMLTGALVERVAWAAGVGIGANEQTFGAQVQQLASGLKGRSAPFTVLIDAVDEANDPGQVVDEVLVPLARLGAGVVRLLVGARFNVVDRLREQLRAERVLVVDLCSVRYADSVAMHSLVGRRLQDAPWFQSIDQETLTGTIDKIMKLAGRSFMVADAIAKDQAARTAAPQPASKEWEASLPSGAGDAMRKDLARRMPEDADVDDLMRLLRPLAYAQGQGLPFERIWPALVTALSPGMDRAAVVGQLRELLDHAGSYLIKMQDDGFARYQLHHRVLADYLIKDRDERSDQRTITNALEETVDFQGVGRRNWKDANQYIRTHLATHAAAAGVVDRYATDPGFLLYAGERELLEALEDATGADARAAADAYRRALPLLRHHEPTEKPGYLGLVARQTGADGLADSLVKSDEDNLEAGLPGSPWLVRWASWRSDQSYLRLSGHRKPVRIVESVRIGGEERLVSVDDDGVVVVSDPADGRTINHFDVPDLGAVPAFAFTRKGARAGVVAADAQGVLKLVDLENGAVEKWAGGHDGPVSVLAEVGSSDPLIVSVGERDRTVHVWSVKTAERIRAGLVLERPAQAIAAAVVAGRPVVAIGDDTGRITVLDLENDDPAATALRIDQPRGVLALAIAVAATGPVLFVGGKSNEISQWNPLTGEHIRSAWLSRLDGDYVRSIAVTEQGGALLVASAGDDRVVWVWDAATGERSYAPLAGHERRINVVGWVSVDGKPAVASGGDDSVVRVWDAGSSLPTEDPFVGHSRLVRAATALRVPALRTSPDGRVRQPPALQRDLLVTAGDDRSVRVWDLDSGSPACWPLMGHRDWVGALAPCELDGRTVVISAGGDGEARVWQVPDGLPDGEPFKGHTGWVGALATAELDGDAVVLSGGRDCSVRIWSLATRREVRKPFTGHGASPVRALVVTELDDAHVVISAGDDGRILVWDLASGAPVGDPYTGHSRCVRSLAVLRQGGRCLVASGGDDRTVQVWNLKTREPVAAAFTGHRGTVRAVALAELRDGVGVYSAGDDAVVHTWNLADGRPLGDPFTGHHREVRALAVRPHADAADQTVISAGGAGAINMWRPVTSQHVDFPRPRHLGPVHSLAVADAFGRRVLVSGSADRLIRLWDADTGAAIGQPLTGHKDRVRAVAAMKSDEHLHIVSGSEDTTVRVWTVNADGAVVAADSPDVSRLSTAVVSLRGHRDWVRAVAIGKAAGRTYVVSASGDGSVRRWDTDDGLGSQLIPASDRFMRAVTIGPSTTQPIVVAGNADGTVRAWDLESSVVAADPWQAHPHGVRAVVVATLGDTAVLLSSGDDYRVRVWATPSDGREIAEPLETGLAEVQALAAVGHLRLRGSLRVAAASGDRVRVAKLVPAGAAGAAATWEPEVSPVLRSKVLSMAWIDYRTLAVGCTAGILILNIPL